MKWAGVIGYPLTHTLSPILQQAAFDSLNYSARYQAWPTVPDCLEEILGTFRSSDCLGVNVTIPHKEAVISLLDGMDVVADRTGAVNTIVNRGGCLFGHNTDVTGFLRALRDDGGFDPAGARVVVLGAGGAARAVVYALLEGRADSITIVNRGFARAGQLAEDLRRYARGGTVRALPKSYDSLATTMRGCHLLVNCTPIGMHQTRTSGKSPIPAELIPGGILVVDLVYNPSETALLVSARNAGASILGGLPMLVYQGAASLELWTGLVAPVEAMFKAAWDAMGGLTDSDKALDRGRG